MKEQDHGKYLQRALQARNNHKIVDLSKRRKVEIKQDNQFLLLLQEMQARRLAGLPVYPVDESNQPEAEGMIKPYPKPVYAVHSTCKHPLDGDVKWTRGELVYCSETVGGQPGYKSSLVACPHCTEEQRKIHGEQVVQSHLSAKSNIPAYTEAHSWETFPSQMDTEGRDMVRDSILHSIQAMSAGGKGENLFIHGSVQVGKTTLAALAGRECRNARIGVYFTPIRFYLDELKEEMKHEVERSVKQIALYAPVLIIDDLGAENGSKWEIGEIFDLIEGRLCKGLTTIITSNNSPAALRKKWKTAATDPEVQDQGGRIAERLLKHFVSVEVLN